ncbi:MAG: phosphoribosylaminoimidazolesuccinocarboxamide synthase [Rhodospirillales bacterium]|nr:phosphoribosylaminoimidazolesuccinocarboxamide synthase [Rhodospirillales bacterium]MSP79874.1 phosphoribosylaminoimidazolesuccinocarboxamide synthase [Rhodospirillales bacterium]
MDIDTLKSLKHCLTDAHFPWLPNFQRGKVRDSYDLPDGRRVMVATDRQSAFDQVLAAVPFKGQVLTQTARFWFDATADVCPNHVLSYPDPNVTVARRLDMVPVEVVVRDYLTGTTATSIWTQYANGARMLYGHKLHDGMTKNQRLAATLITPTTKGVAGGPAPDSKTSAAHDVPITAAEIVGRGLVAPERWRQIERAAMALFRRGRDLAEARGLILVDTKYEFGIDGEGRLRLADEIHTPDSSRYWLADSYPERLAGGREPESLDKEFLRLWISGRCDPYRQPIPEIPPETLAEFSAKYVRLYEQATGQEFVPAEPETPLRERIERNLKRAFPEFAPK